MKVLVYAFLFLGVASCLPSRNNIQLSKSLKIVRIDTITDHYVFRTKDESNTEVIILGQKDKIEECKPFKKFIIADSAHIVYAIKTGSKYDPIGFTGSIVDGIRIKNDHEMAKIISTCNCFTDKK